MIFNKIMNKIVEKKFLLSNIATKENKNGHSIR